MKIPNDQLPRPRIDLHPTSELILRAEVKCDHNVIVAAGANSKILISGLSQLKNCTIVAGDSCNIYITDSKLKYCVVVVGNNNTTILRRCILTSSNIYAKDNMQTIVENVKAENNTSIRNCLSVVGDEYLILDNCQLANVKDFCNTGKLVKYIMRGSDHE